MKTVNDKIMNNLQMFSGALNDRLYKYFIQSGRSGALPDMMRKVGFDNINQIANGLRAFRTNSGTTGYVSLGSAVELAGDFEIEFTFSKVGTTSGTFISGISDTQDTVVIDVNSNRLRTFAYGPSGGITPIIQLTEAQTLQVMDGKLRSMHLLLQSGTASLFVDGISYGTETWSVASVSVKHFFYRSSATPRLLNGILSDLRITSGGTPIHHWPMNEGSGSTHVDVIGGNNGTIINGQPSDWELFEREPGNSEWAGPELVTDAVWDAPFIVGTQWTRVGDVWRYEGDGTLNALQLIADASQPEVYAIAATVSRISGSGSLLMCEQAGGDPNRIISNAEFLAANPYFKRSVLVRSDTGPQQFKRESGGQILSADISRPSIRRILEIA